MSSTSSPRLGRRLSAWHTGEKVQKETPGHLLAGACRRRGPGGGGAEGVCLGLGDICYIYGCQRGEVFFPFPVTPPSAVLSLPSPIRAHCCRGQGHCATRLEPLSSTFGHCGWRVDGGRTRLFFPTMSKKKISRWGSWARDGQVGPVAPPAPLELPSSLWPPKVNQSQNSYGSKVGGPS